MDELPSPPPSLTEPMKQQQKEAKPAEGDDDGCEDDVEFKFNDKIDEQLTKLKHEMVDLRQLDMLLYSKLLALKQSLGDYKRLIQVGTESGEVVIPSDRLAINGFVNGSEEKEEGVADGEQVDENNVDDDDEEYSNFSDDECDETTTNSSHSTV